MTKLKIAILSLILMHMVNGFCNINKNSIRTKPVIEVNGQEMPGWEKQIVERYSDEEGGSLPVIFRGAAKNWETAVWTPEYFVENFGDVEIVVLPQKVLEDFLENLNNDMGSQEISRKLINTVMKDHIKDITLNANQAAYFIGELNHNMTSKEFEGIIFNNDELRNNVAFLYNQLDLEKKTQFPQSIAELNGDERQYSLLIGSEKTITSLHSHGSTFLSQIYGMKLATLSHPKYIEKCYCKFDVEEEKDEQDEERFIYNCAIDILNLDFEKYPELKNIEIYQIILEPGDVLYIPTGWLHDIRALSTSISIASGF